MPKALLDFLGYASFFWSNENNEPPHIHVSKGSPTENATKFWITKAGIRLEHNNSQIPAKDLKRSAVTFYRIVRILSRRGTHILD